MATAEDSDLPTLVATGVIGARTLVWNEGMSDWQALGAVRPDLFEGRPPMPPVPVGGGVVVAPPSDSLAVVSLICGITGILCVQVLAIPAVICGHIAYNRAKALPVPCGNSSAGTALAGIITGYIGLLLLVFILIYFLVVGAVFWNLFPAILEGAAGSGELVIDPFDLDEPGDDPFDLDEPGDDPSDLDEPVDEPGESGE